jgi:hypothetical protein
VAICPVHQMPAEEPSPGVRCKLELLRMWNTRAIDVGRPPSVQVHTLRDDALPPKKCETLRLLQVFIALLLLRTVRQVLVGQGALGGTKAQVLIVRETTPAVDHDIGDSAGSVTLGTTLALQTSTGRESSKRAEFAA